MTSNPGQSTKLSDVKGTDHRSLDRSTTLAQIALQDGVGDLNSSHAHGHHSSHIVAESIRQFEQKGFCQGRDVLSGRGEVVKCFNQHYLALIRAHHPQFTRSKSNLMKHSVAQAVLKQIRSNGGRFLRADSGQELTPKQAKSKVMKALKDCHYICKRTVKVVGKASVPPPNAQEHPSHNVTTTTPSTGTNLETENVNALDEDEGDLLLGALDATIARDILQDRRNSRFDRNQNRSGLGEGCDPFSPLDFPDTTQEHSFESSLDPECKDLLLSLFDSTNSADLVLR